MSSGARRTAVFLHWRVVLPVIGMIAAMTGLVIYSPTLYAVLCDLTGYGGTVQRRAEIGPAPAEAAERKVEVLFDAHVDPRLERKSVVLGQSGIVRVDLGGRSMITNIQPQF